MPQPAAPWVMTAPTQAPPTAAAGATEAAAEGGDAAEAALREWPVSKRVNRPGADDDPALIEPVEGNDAQAALPL